MNLSEKIQIHSGEADPKQSETLVGRDVLDEWANKADNLESQSADLLEVLKGFLELHATFMADAGFNPPVCECELCMAGRKAKEK